MCGIVGYCGPKNAKSVLYGGLRRLEYRGYDSAGIAVIDAAGEVQTVKSVGKVGELDADTLPPSSIGIGHTRWATHGGVTDTNAHPHTYGAITLVHNGIIENFDDLATRYGFETVSDTDTEVLAALIDHYFQATGSLKDGTLAALAEVQGTYGIVAMSADAPDQLVAARKGSPLVIGVGRGEHIIASDPQAIASHTDNIIFLDDGELAVVEDDDVNVYNLANQPQAKDVEEVERAEEVDKAGFDSFLEKEIHEQPRSLSEVMRGRISADGRITLGGPNLTPEQIAGLDNIMIIGCGTAYYAGLYAKYELEDLLGIPVQVEHASEFRYRHSAYAPETSLAIFMSQSGETADTLAALEEAKRRGVPTMGIVNTVGSTLARSVTHGGIYLHAGTEVSVASTKAYSSMVVALLMFGGFIADRRGQRLADIRALAEDLANLPHEMELCIKLSDQIKAIAAEVADQSNWFVLGRGNLFPIALEGALKVTEVSYIHAQAFPTGEMKHGPISLVDPDHISVVLLPEDKLLYDKSVSGIQEIKAREGRVLSISSRPAHTHSDWHITVPMVSPRVSGLIMNCCMQLLALHVAERLGRDTDRPRNLAKSVTVE